MKNVGGSTRWINENSERTSALVWLTKLFSDLTITTTDLDNIFISLILSYFHFTKHMEVMFILLITLFTIYVLYRYILFLVFYNVIVQSSILASECHFIHNYIIKWMTKLPNIYIWYIKHLVGFHWYRQKV